MQSKIKPNDTADDEFSEMKQMSFLSPDGKSPYKSKIKISGLYESEDKSLDKKKTEDFNNEAEDIIKNAKRHNS